MFILPLKWVEHSSSNKSSVIWIVNSVHLLNIVLLVPPSVSAFSCNTFTLFTRTQAKNIIHFNTLRKHAVSDINILKKLKVLIHICPKEIGLYNRHLKTFTDLGVQTFEGSLFQHLPARTEKSLEADPWLKSFETAALFVLYVQYE